MRLEADLEWLFSRQRFGMHPGLTRVHSLLTRLGEPQRAFRVVLVGGTNGKGSTAASLASMLRAQGRRVGLFTSPHLTRFAERFVVGGELLPDDVVLRSLHQVRPHAEAIEASFFEIVTALGCLVFAEAGVQDAVMEVGLGGRLDATNALDPVLSVITNVALDHTEVLGNTVELIAAEKAGILRPGRPAVTGAAPDVWPMLEAEGADLWSLENRVRRQSLGWDGEQVVVRLPAGVELTFRTPLLGAHGAQNAALAAAAAYRLGVSPEAISRGAQTTQWPGRMEVLTVGEGRVLLDGAHNPAGAEAVVRALRDLGVGKLPLVFGAAADKDLSGVAAALEPVASQVVLTRARLSPRSADPAALAPLFPGHQVTLTESPEQAIAALRALGAPLALVCGSLYLIGEVRPLLLGTVSEERERWQ
ncbi:putative tetrahydrofolate synthase (folylpolyglutamate synthase) [Deinococcus deserti VCD115]|uniref:tetrahydrofolate synthase n=1 Tax=Deinococcus deserti (strain DSM 17065 / CIP 109153 / LMG 22923 / VCD115) TaxID=546414 RepID=C1CYP7_DEIDV|nr:putative tetrahydrofolate synthase (folylpolyglutamate synthase) [Deinococcus deserti VCD115]